MKLKTVFIGLSLLFIITVCCFLLSSCQESAPDESKLLVDFKKMEVEKKSDNDRIYANIDESYSVTKVEIDKSKIDENNATYWVTITFKNDIYELSGSSTIEYSYYQKGGWLLENVTEYKTNSRTIIGALPEEKAEELALTKVYNLGYESDAITLKSRETDLDNLIDKFVFEIDEEGVMWSDKGEITVNIVGDSGWWEASEPEKEIKRDLHPTGVWGLSGNYGEYEYIEILDSSTNKYIDIAAYYFHKNENQYITEYRSFKIDKSVTDEGDEIYVLLTDSNDIDYSFSKNQFFEYETSDIESDDHEYEITDKESVLSEMEDSYFLYGYYYDDYRGDTTDAIVVPNVKGKKAEDANNILKQKGFGECEFDYPYEKKHNYRVDIVCLHFFYNINNYNVDVTGRQRHKNRISYARRYWRED